MKVALLNIDGKLSEPLTKLVETVGAGIGGLYAPIGTVRQAKADAKAAIIRAEGQEKVATIEQRARHRLEHLEVIRQENIERIVVQAANEMPKVVAANPVSLDWTLQFISLAQDVCDEEMQRIWARILAGEVASPGSFGRRTVEFLKTLEKKEAEHFTLLSGFAFLDEQSWPFLIGDKYTNALIAEKTGRFDLVTHFVAIGLLSSGDELRMCRELVGTRFSYFGRTGEFVRAIEKPKAVRVFDYVFPFPKYTAIGNELFRIASPQPVADYIEKLNDSFNKEFPNLKLKIDDKDAEPAAAL